jgi:hypothetical protein
MDPIVLTLVIAGGVVFLFVLAARLAWYVRTMAENPDGRGAKRADNHSHGRQAGTQAVPAEETTSGDR